MMNHLDLETYLEDLPLGGIRFFPRITSTNDEAITWIEEGCPDLSLVVADAQTAGRGHAGHKWYTPAGSALAFSLVLRPDAPIYQQIDLHKVARLTGLGALAVCQAIQKRYQLHAKIKWPNDVLVEGKKLAGVLTETQWVGNELIAVILGIGINVATESIPPVDWDPLNPDPFPATCMESVFGSDLNRWDVLYTVLEEILNWRLQLSGSKIINTWQQHLAYRGEWVEVRIPGMDETHVMGRLTGLEEDGALKIQQKSGAMIRLQFGEIYPVDSQWSGFSLRPVDSSKK